MPTEHDQEVINETLGKLTSTYPEFKELLDKNPPHVVFDDSRISNPRINAAYFPESNLITFKTGRVMPETVAHEYFHAYQKYSGGQAYCEGHDCETQAYAFEKALYRLEGPHYCWKTELIG